MLVPFYDNVVGVLGTRTREYSSSVSLNDKRKGNGKIYGGNKKGTASFMGVMKKERQVL